MNLVSTSRLSNYWGRFPFSLRVIIKARLWTAIGTGGVLYLSPLIFNNLGFTSTVKKPESKCLYYAEHDIQFFKEKFHYDLHSNLCYNGLKPNSYIPVDKAFEDYCFKTKIKSDDV